MESEETLRGEILERVKRIFELREQDREFVPGKTRIHYAGRVFDEKEMQAAVDSALDFWLTLGEKGDRFSEEFASYMGMKHCLVTNSGSSANLLAVGALCSPNLKHPLRPGDEVVTTALAFPTTLNPVLLYGLVPVFVDVEEGTYNLDAEKLEAAFSEKTRAVLFAHTLGNPAEMDKIMEFARAHDLYVIEDTCDALDSLYGGKRCGTFGDLSTYSFYAAHHITMGEGGALLTNSLGLYRQALSLRDWGRACYCRTGEKDPNGACGHRFDHVFEGLPDGYDHKYVYSNIGYNLKPLDLQCAIGLEQLKKLPEFTRRRKENFAALLARLKKHEGEFVLPRPLPKADPSWFALPLTVRDGAPFTRRDIVTFLEQNQIETRMLFSGNILRHPGYRSIRHRVAGELANTDRVLNGTFFVGVYPGLTEEMIGYMADVFDRFSAEKNGAPAGGEKAAPAERPAEPPERPPEPRPTVSIVLLGYNHLEYTKLCVESLYRYTKDVDFELITVNNGSSDGTEDYFNSLPNQKKLSFPENIGYDRAVNLGFREAEGKYILTLSNDIVLTSRWLDNLLACMESDDKIGMVVPVCGFSSNFQQVDLPARSLDEMQKLAEQYNKSSPARWEDRMRLVTYVCLFRAEALRAAGGFDEEFNPGCYDDDAISFSIRRLGYRLILAVDTYVHHFGSVTFREEYVKTNVAARNHALFFRKFGVDSWAASAFDRALISLADYARTGEVRLLGIGMKCGASLLQIKNVYRNCGNRDVRLFYLSGSEPNLTDLSTVCEECAFVPAEEVGLRPFGPGAFDLIAVEYDAGTLADPEGFFGRAAGMLRPGGRLLAPLPPALYPRVEGALRESGVSPVAGAAGGYFSFGKIGSSP